ncbi:FecCD family ABC transporter permease [Crossiella cryophila]|uniref:Iron complex transport system permease protein n=1 Tax=Crossiella cryophila TaxID=43355 RepID=A0A7W7CI44_9PSEU|nr:iron ABC transporter permease [Crossiella cryophila]MBB4681687.1 iron complex transport system permease protein [Crossiella cryophila]
MTAAAVPTRLRFTHLALTLLLLLAVVTLAVLLGAIDLGWQRVLGEILAQLTGGLSPLSAREAAILWELRVPRVVLACLVGAALASSGAAFQGVFRNPLADPYLLGAAAGAGLGATLAVFAVPTFSTGLGALPIAAFAGAVLGVGLTWALGRSAGPGTATLVLAGVAVAAFLTALQTFVQTLDVDSLRTIYTWMLGGLGGAGWSQVLVVLPYIALSSFVLCASGRLLDVLGVGDEEAAALGLHPRRVRLIVLGAASLATAAAVSVSGLIGFVGIVVPHVVRLLVAGSYRVLVPLSLLGGASFVVLADMVARTVIAPGELPIGVITAFTGAPFFAVVLRRSRRL